MQKLMLLLLTVFPLSILAAEPVAVWAYQPSPPFASGQNPGLSEALVQLLNEHPTNQDRYDFQLTQLPRKRLDARLEDKEPGILLWATGVLPRAPHRRRQLDSASAVRHPGLRVPQRQAGRL